ncbi:MAG: DUF4065 domain-containing protein [Spirochaetes bacterium]|nr:DUF4065 domain-containing protein [Spirochaetota bacterium]
MNTINLHTLLLNILKSVKEYRDGILITRLIKMAYLVEVLYYRKFHQRLTDAQWVYYKYGPYIMDIDTHLSDRNIIAEEIEDKELTKFMVKDYAEIDEVPAEVQTIISSIIRKYHDVELSDLLDYVYYETEPMMNADQRGEVLDFLKILPSEYYKVKKLECSDDVIKDIKLKYKEKIKNAKHL